MKITETSLNFFKEIGMSIELIDFLKEFSYKTYLDFDGISFSSVYRMRLENLNPINKEIYKQNLFIIGAGLNGDPIVINTRTMKVGFVSHDKLFPNDGYDYIDEIYVDLNMSMGEFFYQATIERKFPIDADTAQKYLQKKKNTI
ncbi:hypothetical protein [Myroides sp.]|uniref:hypothetical protein n=1 Tax=Myroides sp. TaxID=1874736 RepID=UPI003F3E7E18